MKKNLFIIAFCLFVMCSGRSFAQDIEYKKLRVGIGASVGTPTYNLFSSDKVGTTSFSFMIEPQYNLSPSFAVGARIAYTIMGRNFENKSISVVDGGKTFDGQITTGKGKGEISASFFYTLQGTLDAYLVKDRRFRPFAGVGVGFIIGGLSSSDGDFNKTYLTFNGSERQALSVLSPSGASFMVSPRIGFDWGHLRVSAIYNIVPADLTTIKDFSLKTSAGSTDNTLDLVTIKDLSFSNIALEVLFTIGGGKK